MGKRTFRSQKSKHFVLRIIYDPLDFVIHLAKDTCIVLLNGSGFDGPDWSIRASLANLDKDDYKKIGKGVRLILDEYALAWKKAKGESK